MSRKLYYDDAYLKRFRARIVRRSADGNKVVLDSTAFYPVAGGQPHDLGSINGVAVLAVEEDDEGIVWHHTAESIADPEVDCEVDWERRFDHMQQHSGQHLLSAVLEELFRFKTISFHLGAEVSTIDIAAPSISPEQIRSAERRCAEIVFENRSVSVAYEDAGAAEGLRKASDRKGTLRIVSIAGIDRSACGGTHVRNTGEIGPVIIRGLEKVRGNARIEFVCGYRALRAARADFEALSAIARTYSTALAEAPAVAAAQHSRLSAAEKAVEKLAVELAVHKGRDRYQSTEPTANGLRTLVQRLSGPITGEIRAESRGFTAEGRAVYVAVSASPGAVLIATSPASGLDAAAVLKVAAQIAGGKGGGSARLAQGSIPEDSAEAAIAAIENMLRA